MGKKNPENMGNPIVAMNYYTGGESPKKRRTIAPCDLERYAKGCECVRCLSYEKKKRRAERRAKKGEEHNG